MPIPIDEKFPEWGEGHYFRLTLKARVTVHDALSHMYVLLPALDEEKHYYIGDAEVDKLLRHGEGWLGKHPDRQLIVQRYLKQKTSLVDRALARLLDEENVAVEAAESKTERAALAETDDAPHAATEPGGDQAQVSRGENTSASRLRRRKTAVAAVGRPSL